MTLTLASIASALLFTLYRRYDDEGYVLWSIKNVAEGHSLYGEIYSQYGPFFHEFYRVLGWLGYPFTNDSARIITGICWLATALLSGLIVRRLTTSAALGWAAQICAFILLRKCCSEPGHPGGLLALFVAFSAWSGVELIRRGRLGTFALTQGALVAALGLSKINQGVFQLIALVTWWPFAWPQKVAPATRRAALLALIVVAGTGLMLALLDRTTIQLHLGVFIAGSGALALTRPNENLGETPFRFMALALLGAMTVTVFAFGGAWLGGSSAADLIRYTFWEPIRHPGVYSHLVKWSQWFSLWSALSLGAALVWMCGGPRMRVAVLALGKSVAVVLLLHACWHAASFKLEVTWFMFGPLFAWVLALPLHKETSASLRHARWWLAWLFCWQWLQGYPVAGTQTSWGSFLAIPLVFVGVGDLIASARRPRLDVLLLLVAGVAAYAVGASAFKDYKANVPVDLPGARWVRLEPAEASRYQHLAKIVPANGDVLFTYPGMVSLNAWFDMPAPALAHATHWFSLLNDARQRQIIDGLKAAKAPVIVVDRDHVLYLIEKDMGPKGLLKDYLQATFRPALRFGPHDLWVRREATLVPVSTARLLQVGDQNGVVFFSRASAGSIHSIDLQWVDLAPAHNIELARMGAWRPLPLPEPFSSLQTHDGQPLPSRYFLPLQDIRPWSSPSVKELRLLDAEGRVLDLLRFDDLGIPDPIFTAAPPPPTN